MPHLRPALAALAALALALALAAGAAGCGSAGAAAPSPRTAAPPPDTAHAAAGVRLVKVGDFSAPLQVTAPPGDRRRAFVVEQAGRIWVVRDGKRLPEPFLDI